MEKNIKIAKYPILFMADHFDLIEKFIVPVQNSQNDLNDRNEQNEQHDLDIKSIIDLELPIKLLDMNSPIEIKLLVVSIIEKVY